MIKNMTEAKSSLAFTRYRQNLNTVGSLTVTNCLQSPQEFNAKKGTCTLRIDKPRLKAQKNVPFLSC